MTSGPFDYNIRWHARACVVCVTLTFTTWNRQCSFFHWLVVSHFVVFSGYSLCKHILLFFLSYSNFYRYICFDFRNSLLVRCYFSCCFSQIFHLRPKFIKNILVLRCYFLISSSSLVVQFTRAKCVLIWWHFSSPPVLFVFLIIFYNTIDVTVNADQGFMFFCSIK